MTHLPARRPAYAESPPSPTHLPSVARTVLLVLATTAGCLLGGGSAWAMTGPEPADGYYSYVPPLQPAAASVPVMAFVLVALFAALAGVVVTLALQVVLHRRRATVGVLAGERTTPATVTS